MKMDSLWMILWPKLNQMKISKLTTIFLLLITISSYAQPRNERPVMFGQKHNYRPPPSIGESISIAGVGMLAYTIASYGNRPRVLVYSGFAFCFAGVAIDINGHDGKRKLKFLASNEGIGIRINF